MKVLVQWTTTKPGDWEELELKPSGKAALNWVNQPAKPLPDGSEELDGQKGWVFALNVQGVVLSGHDHYAIKPIKNGGVKVYVWNNDPEDHEAAWGEEWTFNPLRKDPRFGGQLNTNQKKVIYSDSPQDLERQETTGGPVVVKPWFKFPAVPKVATRHGVWVRDKNLYKKHLASPRRRAWGEWK